MIRLEEELFGVKTLGVAGHVRPDGDCMGACLAVKSYIQDNFPGISTDIYLETKNRSYMFLRGADEIITEAGGYKEYDLFISIDVSTKERLGFAEKYFDAAKRTLCIDHHVTNPGFALKNWVDGAASSASEMIYLTMDDDLISKETAECLYVGIINDTGVFQYSGTTERTMQIAGRLMSKGIEFTRIIEDSFYKKTYVQNQILGRTLMESILLLDGRVIVGGIRMKDMDFYGVGPQDLEGIVSQLRVTEGVEVAIFLHETANQEYKVSLRSNGKVDVSAICSYFGGGGHVKAAGATLRGSYYDVINNLTLHIENQLNELE